MTPQPVLRVAEPSPPCLAGPPLVVDCSALAAVLFQEPWQEQALARLAGHALFAPVILPLEICNVALKKMRRGAEVAAADGLEQWQDLGIELLRVDLTQTFALARRYGLTAYDAAYLWLAADLRCPLATFDSRLGEAAQAHLPSLP